MNKLQVFKMMKIFIPITVIMILLELVFLIPDVTNFFTNWFNESGWSLYLVIWVLTFLQVTILNIPGVTILQLSLHAGINLLSWQFLLVNLSASLVGCIVAYWFGRQFGSKAVKWIAGDINEFNKWTYYINKRGKTLYFLTVLFPLFPDDLLCIVVGAIKFHFGYFVLFNLIGRGVGTITMILTLNSVNSISNNFPTMLVFWCIALIAEIIIYYIVKRRLKND